MRQEGLRRTTPHSRILCEQRSFSPTPCAAAYGPLYEANEGAHKLPSEGLRGLIAQVAGSDSDMTNKIAGTFNALVGLGDFDGTQPEEKDSEEEREERGAEEEAMAQERQRFDRSFTTISRCICRQTRRRKPT